MTLGGKAHVIQGVARGNGIHGQETRGKAAHQIKPGRAAHGHQTRGRGALRGTHGKATPGQGGTHPQREATITVCARAVVADVAGLAAIPAARYAA